MRKHIERGMKHIESNLKYIEYILMVIFITRPVIDLFWQNDLIFGMNLAGMVALLLVGLTVVYVFFRRERLKDNVVITGLVFAGLMFIVTLFNATSYTDFDYFLRFCSGISFLIILAPSIDEDKLQKCLLGFVLLTIVPIVITFLQRAGLVAYTYFDYVDGVKISRGSGGYRQPSVLTRFCAFGLLYVLYLLETKWKTPKFKVFALCYGILNVIAVLLSYHRTGYLLIILLVAVWFFWKYRNNLKQYIGRILIAGAAVLAVFFVLYATGLFSIDLSVFKSMLSLDNIIRIENGTVELVLRGRGSLINKLIQGFRQNPVIHTIFGNGTYVNAHSGIEMQVADMDLVRVLWNCGIVGFVAWIVHYGTLFNEIRKCAKQHRVTLNINLAICVFLCFVIWGLTLETTATPNIMYHCYLVCGFVCFDCRRKAQQLHDGN